MKYVKQNNMGEKYIYKKSMYEGSYGISYYSFFIFLKIYLFTHSVIHIYFFF